MNKSFKGIILILGIFMMADRISAQQRLPFTADSLTTGNFKDVFKSFFQVAANKITSRNKEIQFTTNPFAVMAKMDTTLFVDTSYYQLRKWRNLNFSFAANIDSALRLNGFSTGIKYAIINRRDETVSRAFLIEAYNANNELNQLNNKLNAFLSSLPAGPEKSRLRAQVDGLINTGNLTFEKVDIDLQERIKIFASEINAVRLLKLLKINPNLNFRLASKQNYDSLKLQFQNKLLWTAELSDTSFNSRFFSNIAFSTQVLKGVLNPANAVNMEIDVKASAHFIDDTILTKRDLKRTLVSFEPGVNFVFKSKQTQKSWAECKLSGSFRHNFTSLYHDEKRDVFMVASIVRVRVINDLWIPIEIQYDPSNGNVFGFLNLRANFTALSHLFKVRT